MKKTIKTLMLAFCLLAALCVTAYAAEPVIVAEGTCGESLTWTLDDTGLLTVEGSGAMTNYSSTSHSPWSGHAAQITSVRIGDEVTTVGSYAFYEHAALTELHLGRGVTELKMRAFAQCTALAEVTLSDDLDVYSSQGSVDFSFCAAPITVVHVPATVTAIEEAVYSMSMLDEFDCAGDGSDGYFDVDGILYHKDGYTGVQTLITVPDSMDLPQVATVAPGTHHIAADAFRDCDTFTYLDLPDGLLTIGSDAFRSCDYLLEVEIPDSVTAIKARAFYECGWLIEVHLGRETAEVGLRAFAQCPDLITLTVGDNTTVYASDGAVDYSFNESPVAIVAVPATVTAVDPDLYNKTSIKEFVAAESHTDGYFEVDGVLYHKEAYTGTQTLVKVPHSMDLPDIFTVLEGTNVIGEKALYDNDSFTLPVLPDSLQTIEANAFYDCDNMVGVTLPGALQTIGSDAFRHCDSLIDIDVPDSVTAIKSRAFYQCNKLEEVHLGRNVTELSLRAFAQCPALTTLTLPDDVQAYSADGSADYSFNESPIAVVYVPETVTDIDPDIYGKTTIREFIAADSHADGYFDVNGVLYHKDAYTDTQTLVKVPHSMDLPETYWVYDGTTVIGEKALYDNDSFAYIDLPDGLLTIETSAFQDCDYLIDIEIPDSVTAVKAYAFRHCDRLEEVRLGRSVANLGVRAFSVCPKLTVLTVADAVAVYATHGSSDFSFASSPIEVLYVPETVTDLDFDLYNMTSIKEFVAADSHTDGYFDVDGVLYHQDKYTGTQTLVKAPHAMDLPDTVVVAAGTDVIGKDAFYDNDSFAHVDLPDGLLTVEEYAFYDCDLLEDLEIPDSVTLIAKYAFAECNWLTEVVIGRSIDQIAASAFRICAKLTEVRFRGDAPASLGTDVFKSAAADFAIYYPEEANGWSTPTWNSYPAYPYSPDDLPYVINSLTVGDLDGNELNAIPDDLFHANISITNKTEEYMGGTVMLAVYTEDGQFRTWVYITMKDCPAGATMEFSLLVDNRDGDVGFLKAFVTESIASMLPMGEAVVFGE